MDKANPSHVKDPDLVQSFETDRGPLMLYPDHLETGGSAVRFQDILEVVGSGKVVELYRTGLEPLILRIKGTGIAGPENCRLMIYRTWKGFKTRKPSSKAEPSYGIVGY